MQASYTQGLTIGDQSGQSHSPGVIKIFQFHTENEPWLKAYECSVVPISAKWIPLRAGILTLGRPLEAWCSPTGHCSAEKRASGFLQPSWNKGSLRTGLSLPRMHPQWGEITIPSPGGPGNNTTVAPTAVSGVQCSTGPWDPSPEQL